MAWPDLISAGRREYAFRSGRHWPLPEAAPPVSRALPREVTVIRKKAPFRLVAHYPQTEAGTQELALRISDVRAQAVNQYLKSLNCPNRQKLELLDAIMAAREESTDP